MAPEFITPEELAEVLIKTEKYYTYLKRKRDTLGKRLSDKEHDVLMRSKMLLRKANML